MFFFILITCLLDIVLALLGEILCWSFLRVKGFTRGYKLFVSLALGRRCPQQTSSELTDLMFCPQR